MVAVSEKGSERERGEKHPLIDVLGDPRSDDDECQVEGSLPPSIESELLTGHEDRDRDRVRLLRYLVSNPSGVILSQIVRDVFDKSGGVTADSDYQFTRRFFTSNDEYFKIYEQNGMTAVEFRISLLDLISEGTTQKRDLGLSGKDFCRSLLGNISSLDSNGKDLLSAELEDYVDRIEDYRLLFEAVALRSNWSRKFTLPYKTRFNSESRIKQQWARYNDALEYARDEYDNAALVTLTTDPKRFPNLLEGILSINSNFNRLMSWMDYEPKTKPTSRPGYRPPYLKALEFTEDGKPHLHVLFFDVPTRDGRPWLIDKNELSERWADLGQGRIVDIQGLEYRDDLDSMYDTDEGFVSLDECDRLDAGDLPVMSDGGSGGIGGGCTAGQYLGKYLSVAFGGLFELAESGGSDSLSKDFATGADSDDIESGTGDGAYSDRADRYKIALYWATGRRFWTISEDIQKAIEPDEDEEDEEYDPVFVRFIGCYKYWDLPMSVTTTTLSLDGVSPIIGGETAETPENGDSGGDIPPPDSPAPMASD